MNFRSRKMLRLIRRMVFAWAIAVLAGCAGGGADDSFRLEIQNNESWGKPVQDVKLYRLLPEYGALTLVDSVPLSAGRAVIDGFCPNESEAFVRFGQEDPVYPFVLSSGRFQLVVENRYDYRISGGGANRRLTDLMKAERDMRQQRNILQSEYRSMAADSTLNKVKEDSLVAAYQSRLESFRHLVDSTIMWGRDSSESLSRVVFRKYAQLMPAGYADSVAVLVRVE